jgi:diacylglycerol kinase family enzyme
VPVSLSFKLGNHKESFYFLCQTCLGLGAALDRYYQRWAKKHSFLSRFSSITHGIVAVGLIYHSYKQKIVPVSLDLEQQGNTTPVRTPFLIFTNTSIMGGKLRLSPFASPFDGKLDCCILDALPFFSLLFLFFRFNLQKKPESKKIEILQDKDFKIYSPHPLDIQADGKVFRTNGEIEISTLPRALNIIVGPNLNPAAPSSRDRFPG